MCSELFIPVMTSSKFSFRERVYFSLQWEDVTCFPRCGNGFFPIIVDHMLLGINRGTVFYSFFVAVDPGKEIRFTEDLCLVHAYSRSECYNAILKWIGVRVTIAKRIINKHKWFKTVGLLSDHIVESVIFIKLAWKTVCLVVKNIPWNTNESS